MAVTTNHRDKIQPNQSNQSSVKYRKPLRWYFEDLSRKDAGVMLNKSQDGSYLVRASETKPGCFSLSCRVPDLGDDSNGKKASTIKHYIIRHSKENGG